MNSVIKISKRHSFLFGYNDPVNFFLWQLNTSFQGDLADTTVKYCYNGDYVLHHR